MAEGGAPAVFRLKTLKSQGGECREPTTPGASCYSKHFALSHKATERAEFFRHQAASYF